MAKPSTSCPDFAAFIAGIRTRYRYKPISRQYAFNLVTALNEYGVIGNDFTDDDFVDVVQSYCDAYLFPHWAATVRKPDKRARCKYRRMAATGSVPGATNEPLMYSHKDVGLDYNTCSMMSLVDGGYWQKSKALKIPDSRSSQRAMAEYEKRLRDLRDEYGRSMTYSDVIRHLIGHHFGDHHAEWYYLGSEPDLEVPYFVLDLDDKEGQIRWPEDPRPTIVEAFEFLTYTKLLSPGNAVVVSSPGGRQWPSVKHSIVRRPPCAAVELTVPVSFFSRSG